MSVNDVTPCASHTVREAHKGLTLTNTVFYFTWMDCSTPILVVNLSLWFSCFWGHVTTLGTNEWTLTYQLRHMQPARMCSASFMRRVGNLRSRDVVEWCKLAEFREICPAFRKELMHISHIHTFLCCSVQSMAKVIPDRMCMRNISWPTTSCCYPFSKHSQNLFAHYTLLTTAWCFQSVISEVFFTLTNGNLLVLAISSS
jgi:hypothetical protein